MLVRHGDECVRLVERLGDRLLDEDVDSPLQRFTPDVKVRARRHHDDGRLDPVQQRRKGFERARPELTRDPRRPLGTVIVEPGERGTGKLAQETNVVIAQRARADDSDADAQITTPRSLRSKNRRNSSTSGMRRNSVSARARACETFSSDLKNMR